MSSTRSRTKIRTQKQRTKNNATASWRKTTPLIIVTCELVNKENLASGKSIRAVRSRSKPRLNLLE